MIAWVQLESNMGWQQRFSAKSTGHPLLSMITFMILCYLHQKPQA